jgi:uncharacterized protein (TIGR02266 family)
MPTSQEMLLLKAEKRRAHRVRVNLRARYRSETCAMDAWVANVSRFGLFIRSDFLDSEGTPAAVDLEVPGGTPLHLDGEVVRVDVSPLSSGMGIRFNHMADPVRRALANLMIERSCRSTA